MNTALVTGATGFIGQWLTRELLEHGIRVYAVVRPGSENMGKLPEHRGLTVISCELQDYGHLPDRLPEEAMGGIDVCYHLAWEGVRPEIHGLSHSTEKCGSIDGADRSPDPFRREKIYCSRQYA